MITENLSTLKIHKLTQTQYDRELEAGNIDPNALYLTPDEANNLGNYTETDPTVPSWAKQPTKPTYTASEVGALADTTVIPTIPTNVSAFTNDSNYVTQEQLDAIDWFSSGTSIPANSDLNNYTTPGKYFVASTSTAATIVNAPVTNTNYTLFVFTRTSSKSITQLIIGLNNKMYLRSATSNGNLSSWTTCAISSELENLNTKIENNTSYLNDQQMYISDLEDTFTKILSGTTYNTIFSNRSLTWDGCIDNREYIINSETETSRLVAVRMLDDIPDDILSNIGYLSHISPIITKTSIQDNLCTIFPGENIEIIEIVPNIAYGLKISEFDQSYPDVIILLEDTTISIDNISMEGKKGIYFLTEQELNTEPMMWISKSFPSMFAMPPLDISPKSLEKHIEIELLVPYSTSEEVPTSSMIITRMKGNQKTIETYSLTAKLTHSQQQTGDFYIDVISFEWNDLTSTAATELLILLANELHDANSFKIILNNKAFRFMKGISHSYGLDYFEGISFDFGSRLYVRISTNSKTGASEPV